VIEASGVLTCGRAKGVLLRSRTNTVYAHCLAGQKPVQPSLRFLRRRISFCSTRCGSQVQEALRIAVCDLLFVGRADRQLLQEGTCLHHRTVGIVGGEHDPVDPHLKQ
jgi:hypothetical protein